MIFPDPDTADEDGLLAIGGNLEPDTLIEAYRSGIFPWFAEGQPILWWSPDPRMVLFPENLKISHSLRQILKKGDFCYSFDTSFHKVINACATIHRTGQDGTWITEEIIEAYTRLHEMGYAHSVETWYGDKLAGGLYGIAIGKVFFGESMFHYINDASKVALYVLVEYLKEQKYKVIDTQQSTDHLKRLGGEEISRNMFLEIIHKACNQSYHPGKWDTPQRLPCHWLQIKH